MNEQAETKLSTAKVRRERWARRRASAIAAALRLKAAVTAGEKRGSAGAGPVTAIGCATEARRSASRDMATTPLSTGVTAGARSLDLRHCIPMAETIAKGP